MSDDLNSQLVAASKAIVESDSRRKLIVAGPGTGKTFTFKGLLEKNGTAAGNALVLTFINNLKDDLERDLSGLAEVFTFHGHCLRLLYRYPSIRRGLTAKFEFFPSLPSLIKSDWNVIENGTAPKFVGMMRQLNSNADTEFYMQRSNFYDAVSYDDSLYRVYNRLQQRSENLPQYQLVLVDEYQDFNLLEASLIHLLSERSPLVIAGDDDQALYVQLRGSAPKFIRDLYNSGEFELFELPFSMRCTQPVVNAIRDVLSTATSKGKLAGRIPKRYEYSPPQKADDSARYPRIMTVHTSVQSKRDNYFGKYIEREIAKIPPEEIVESNGGYFPTVLIIGAKHYTSSQST